MNRHPYRAHPSADAPRAAGLSQAWSHSATAPLIIAAGPVALVTLCAIARACEGSWLMPTTILYSAIGYVAFLLGACAIDSVRR